MVQRCIFTMEIKRILGTILLIENLPHSSVYDIIINPLKQTRFKNDRKL